jgi:tetratricopeptide (TPR) repeat protein
MKSPFTFMTLTLALVATILVTIWRSPAATLAAQTAEQQGGNNKQEQALVLAVHAARDQYQRSLERLHGYYIRAKNDDLRYWVEQELTQFHMMVKDPYIMELDLPPKDLRPTQHIPEANKILADARAQLDRPTLTEVDKNQHRAELLLRRLIRDYPQSDKVDDACFYLGEIYSSKHFEQYRRAVAFYERCFLYDPSTTYPARLKAGLVYERNLADREHAKQLYQEVLQRQTDPAQTREARRRLDRLLGTKKPGGGALGGLFGK